jgi:hypothetical protein
MGRQKAELLEERPTIQSIIGRTTSKKVQKYRAILEALITGAVDDHFATCLIDDKLFVKYIKLCMGME